MPIKPSRNEEEHFAKLEAERLARRREQAAARRAAEELEAQRKLHYMRCPKCGDELREVTYHGVQVDRCAGCGGLWFDAGEAEGLLERDPGAVGGFLHDLIRGLGGRKSAG